MEKCQANSTPSVGIEPKKNEICKLNTCCWLILTKENVQNILAFILESTAWRTEMLELIRPPPEWSVRHQLDHLHRLNKY